MFESVGYVTPACAPGAKTLAARRDITSTDRGYFHTFNVCSPDRPMQLTGLMLGRFFQTEGCSQLLIEPP